MKQLEAEKIRQVQQIKVCTGRSIYNVTTVTSLSQNEFEAHRVRLTNQLHQQQQDNERTEQVSYHGNTVNTASQ